jgi:hypothetical protein
VLSQCAVLEGPEVGDAIQRVFDLQVVRTLATRGKQLPTELTRRR